MSLWDGLTTSPDCQITIIAATNRPWDLDEAIQRRLPQTFFIGNKEVHIIPEADQICQMKGSEKQY